jgi:hypothetical protein
MYYGSWKINDTLTFVCNTHNPTNGMATAADAVPTYHVYEDETATPLITGSMATLNGSLNTLGFYSEQITLSAANGFEKGRSYNVYIRAVVNNVTGTMAHFFQMEAEVDANVVSDKSSYSLSSPQAFDLNGNITGTFVGNLQGNVTGNVQGSVASVTAPVGISTGTFLEALADKVWDEAIAGHLAVGSTGEKLNAAGAAGDPWSTSLPGSYVAGQAGHILASRMPTGTVIVSSNQDKTGYFLGTPQVFDWIGNHTGTMIGNIEGTLDRVNNAYLVNNQIINISGTFTNVRNVLNPVTAGNVTGTLSGVTQSNVRDAVGLAAADLDSQLSSISSNASLTAQRTYAISQLTFESAQNIGSTGNDTTHAHLLNSKTYSDDVLNNTLLVVEHTGTYHSRWIEDWVSSSQLATLNSALAFAPASPDMYWIFGFRKDIGPVIAGMVTGSVLGNVNGSVNSVVQPVGISTGTFLEALADKVWDESISGHLVAGSTGNALNSAGSAGDPWGTPLPGAYTTGQAGHILASRMPTGTVIVGSNQDKTGYSLSSPQNFNLIGNITGTVVGNIQGSVGSVVADVGISTGSFISAIADGVWDEQLSGHQAAGSAGNALSSAGSAGDPWSTPLPGSYVAGQAGHILASRMPTGTVIVSSNQDKTGYSLSNPQNFNLIGNISGTFVGNLQGQVGMVTGSVNSVTNPVTVGTNNDKTGYSLSTPQTFNLIGNITGSISSVVNPVTVGTNNDKTGYGLSTGTFLDAMADKVWDETLSGHLVAGSTGNALNAAGSAGDPWSTSLPGSYVIGQAGHILASRMPTGTVLVGDKTGFSLASPQAFDLIGNITGTITNVLNVVNPVTAGIVTGTFINAIADQVWDEAIASHLAAGSTGEKLNSAGSAGDPWGTALPGSYVAGTAGHILASRMPTGTVVVSSNQDKTGYSLASPQSVNIIGNVSGTFVGNIQGNLTGSVGSLTDIASALGNKIADYVLRRSYASARQSSDGDSPVFRSLLGAVGKLVNRWKINGTTLTVYQEDDATATAPGGTQTLTGTAGADPITEINTD